MPRKLYGSSTEKAIENFPISGWPMPRHFLRVLALIKKHAAETNGSLKRIPSDFAHAISKAAVAVYIGQHDDQFPVDVFQTGSGTSTHMNMNEVLATLAGKGVHPNDHVNHGQSSNDVIPTALQISCALGVRDTLLPALDHLQDALKKKAKEFQGITKTARTHLMDAVPVDLGDEFRSYATLVAQSKKCVQHSLQLLTVLPLGGTAAGTGVNTHPDFARKVIALLAKEIDLPLKETRDHIAAQSCPLAAQSLSAGLKHVAIVLTKIANDIRLMGSGPAAGFAELSLPVVQPGSSMMPGKTNPVFTESVEQVAAWIFGADTTVTTCLSQGSRFELNTCLPLLASTLLTGITLLSNVTRTFADKCVRDIKANTDVMEDRLARNAMLATALTAEIGYDKAALIAQEAIAKHQTILEVAKKHTDIPEKRLKQLLDPRRMT